MSHCIVLWDDGGGLSWPMGWDPDCDGALCPAHEKKPVVVFETLALAKAAIKISEHWNRLLQSQGKPHNSDFIEGKANLRIVKVTFHDAEAG
jgi:hypothetical protein